MPLDQKLMRDVLRFTCPHCRADIERTGSAFVAAKQFRCPSCHEVVKLGYAEKLKLFEQAHRAGERAERAIGRA